MTLDMPRRRLRARQRAERRIEGTAIATEEAAEKDGVTAGRLAEDDGTRVAGRGSGQVDRAGDPASTA